MVTGEASNYKLAGRTAADVQQALDMGPVTLLVIAVGYNEISIAVDTPGRACYKQKSKLA